MRSTQHFTEICVLYRAGATTPATATATPDMLDLSFQYPAAFLILCALLGLGYAALLYYRDTTFREQHPRLHLGLGVLRWLVITLISALLLSPVLKSLLTREQKPIVVLAQDQSQSVGTVLQGPALEAYTQQWQQLRTALGEDYDLHDVSFGDAVREGVDFTFPDKVTNLSELMRTVYDLYGGENLGAVVVASDGIYNEGSNPAYSDAQLSAPVYTVALGDTTPKRDLLIKRVFHNKIAYLGDKFSIQIDVAATNAAGAGTVLTVSKVDGDQTRTLESIPLNIAGNDFFSTREVQIEATAAGVAQYRVAVARISGEVSTVNNVRDIFVDVLDARQKILLLGNGAHPDITALKQSLEGNRNYQVNVAFIGDPGLDVSKYDFVVLHNLPSETNDISGILETLNRNRIPRLFIAGLQTGYGAFNRAQNLVSTQITARQTDDVQGKIETRFAAFTIDPRTVQELPKFNPVTAAFGNFGATPGAQVLLWKRIGRVDTDQPLLAVGETNGIRTGVFMAENLWKWRLFDFLQHENHEIFDEVFGKTVQFLSLKEDKRKFRVTLASNIFNENDAVVFGAELYNANYELVNEPDVAIVVRNNDGKEYPFTFTKTGNAYTLNAGILPVGNYTFRASTTFNGQALTYDGRFSVRPIELELYETTANHAVLRQLSTAYGGEMVYADGLASIAEKIKANQQVKPVRYSTTKTNPLINLKWIFALLAGLLALEWFARRYFGAY